MDNACAKDTKEKYLAYWCENQVNKKMFLVPTVSVGMHISSSDNHGGKPICFPDLITKTFSTRVENSFLIVSV